MNLQIDLSPELDARLRQEAAKQGVDPGQFIVVALQAKLGQESSDTARLSREESQLLAEINRGFNEEQWQRYEQLIEARQREAITDAELAELTAMADQIEHLNAHRMECLQELARCRNTTVPELMDQLGITSPSVI